MNQANIYVKQVPVRAINITCFDVVVNGLYQKQQTHNLATSLGMQAVVVAKAASGIQALQESFSCPKVLRCKTALLA